MTVVRGRVPQLVPVLRVVVLVALLAGLLTPSTARAADVPAGLAPGAEVWSDDRSHRLVMQQDGNLVVYTAAGRPVWAAGTAGPGSRLVLQGDGNAVVVSSAGAPLWATGTHTGSRTRLVLGDDGVLSVLAGTGGTLWRSRPLVLLAGQHVASPDGSHVLVVQGDGNAVVYGPQARVAWASGTGVPGSRLVVQDDGNAVVYAPDGRPLWASGTSGLGRLALTVEDSGLVVLTRPAGRTAWRSVPQALGPGEALLSPQGSHRLVLQADGNLVLYTAGGRPAWASSTWGTGAVRAVLQNDGNLVLSTADGRPVWHTATGSRGSRLAVQDDGNVVLYDLDDRPVWASAGSGGTPVVPAFSWSVQPVTAEELGATWRPGCPVGPSSLRRLDVPVLGLDGRVRPGRVVVQARVVDLVRQALQATYEARFPLHSLRPVSEYGGDDVASMEPNNSSGFNCRYVAGTTRWSEHSYGLALDLNPVQNPHVRGGEVEPASGAPYVDRAVRRPGMLYADSPAVRVLTRAGWGWGGTWTSSKDYMHLSESGR